MLIIKDFEISESRTCPSCTCKAMSRTTIEQKLGGGGWLRRAAVAPETPSEQTSVTIKLYNVKVS